MLISAILTEKSILFRQIEKLSPDFFYFKSNSLLYKAIIEVIHQIEKINLGSLLSKLKTQKLIYKTGGINQILELADKAPTSKMIEEYSSIILDNYIKRLLLKSGDLLYLMSNSRKQITQHNVTSIVNELTVAYEILEHNRTQELAQIFADLLISLDTTKKVSLNIGILSGFKQLDFMTRGFQKSDLVIVAGRPSMGKTAFAINIIRHFIKANKSYVMLFSLEMSIEQILRRILAQECHINSQKIQSGKLTTKEWEHVVLESKKLATVNLYIDDNAKVSSNTIRTNVKFLKLQGKIIDLIIIDYLQLLQDDRQFDNRSQELSLITRSLKILARELNLPIIVLSQLNRNVESRSNKRPLLSDLRESGCISQISRIDIKDQTIAKPALFFTKKILHIKSFNHRRINFSTDSKAQMLTTKEKPVYKIITTFDKYLNLTSNHKILTLKGWQRCDQLIIGDMIATKAQSIKSSNYIFRSSFFNFEKLHKIYLIQFQNVVDFSCSPLNNFIANSIVVHNSIEQDADLVIMLYRESYYDKESEMQEMTEVIIAKHRNGPIGTFQLKFDTKLAEFSNL